MFMRETEGPITPLGDVTLMSPATTTAMTPETWHTLATR